jgi:hypothetical protein
MVANKNLEEKKCLQSTKSSPEIEDYIIKELGIRLLDQRLVDSDLVPYPPTLQVERLASEVSRSLAYVPYCAKPINCPTNRKTSCRKNKDCLKISEDHCGVDCSIKGLVGVLRKHGFTQDQMFIVDSDRNLLKWLRTKRRMGYRHLVPGVGCKYAISYALEFIGGNMGYDGLIIFLSGDICNNMRDYSEMEKGDKKKHTQVKSASVALLDSILSGRFPKGEKNV